MFLHFLSYLFSFSLLREKHLVQARCLQSYLIMLVIFFIFSSYFQSICLLLDGGSHSRREGERLVVFPLLHTKGKIWIFFFITILENKKFWTILQQVCCFHFTHFVFSKAHNYIIGRCAHQSLHILNSALQSLGRS